VAAVIPLVRLAKAAATAVLAMALVAVKVKPLTVAFWPAARLENVITEVSLAAAVRATLVTDAVLAVNTPPAPMAPVVTKVPLVNVPIVALTLEPAAVMAAVWVAPLTTVAKAAACSLANAPFVPAVKVNPPTVTVSFAARSWNVTVDCCVWATTPALV